MIFLWFFIDKLQGCDVSPGVTPRTKWYDPFWIFICIVYSVLFPIRYSIRAAQQDSAFKMTYIWANSINIGWDMTQNILFPFWVISLPNVDGFCSNMGHYKGWILLDTVSYRKQNMIHDTKLVSLSVSTSRNFCIASNLDKLHIFW